MPKPPKAGASSDYSLQTAIAGLVIVILLANRVSVYVWVAIACLFVLWLYLIKNRRITKLYPRSTIDSILLFFYLILTTVGIQVAFEYFTFSSPTGTGMCKPTLSSSQSGIAQLGILLFEACLIYGLFRVNKYSRGYKIAVFILFVILIVVQFAVSLWSANPCQLSA